jgi:uncharacterized protein (TIRG00374 family)
VSGPLDDALPAPPPEPAAAADGKVAAADAGTADRVSADDSAEPPVPDELGVSADQMSLGRRLRQPRTILSLAIPIVLLVLIFRVALNIDFQLLIHSVAQANKLYLLIAFVIFYLGFPVRGYRWIILLRKTGVWIKDRDSSEIIFLSWVVNCLVPAKLGDLYRAYLLKLNAPVSGTRTLGTIFIERILDLFAITILGLAAGLWSFRDGLPPEMQVVAAIGVAVVVILAVILLTLRNFGRRVLLALPLPHRVIEFYDRFEQGLFSIDRRSLPLLLVLTAIIWSTEAFRLYFVVQALAFPDVALGISGCFFVALVGSLLTAVPLSPAGLGIVELGVVGVLVTAYGVPLQEATTIALVDRAISVFSIIVTGGIAYLISGLPRGHGLHTPAVIVPIPGEDVAAA